MRGPLIALGVLVALLATAGAGSAFAYTSIKRDAKALEGRLMYHLELGQKEMEAAKSSLKLANTTHDDKKIGEAKVHFIGAKLHFQAATQIADGSQLLSQLETVPSVGEMARSRHVAVNAVADMGIQIADAGVNLADLDGLLVKPKDEHGGKGLLTVVREVQAKIGPVEADLKSALQSADRVDVNVFPAGQKASFLKAKGSIGQALDAIVQFKALVPVITELLGGNGPKNYLIEQVNPAELRAGGGFIGSWSLLHADQGTITLVKSGDGYDWMSPYNRPHPGERGYVTPPGPLKEFLPETSWTFVDSNFFPDFPSNASAGISFAKPGLGGIQIDGVIAFDYYMVARLIALTGPVPVPGFPSIVLTGDNLVTTLLDWDLRAISDTYAGAVHKAMLGAVAGPLLSKVVTLEAGKWPALISTLNDLAASRHLQTWFANPEAQKAIDQYGWSGVMKPKAAPDYIMEVESNLGGTKANYFMDRKFTLQVTRNGDMLHHTMIVHVWNNMAYRYRPNDFYRAYVRMYVSDSTPNVANDLTRARYASPPPPAGTKMSEGWFTIPGQGHDRSFAFEWDTPWKPNGRGVQQVYWQKQPGTLDDAVEVIWKDGNGHTYKVTGNLGQDRLISLAPSGVTLDQGQVGSAQLPSLGLG
jgi:hypothetical protein